MVTMIPMTMITIPPVPSIAHIALATNEVGVEVALGKHFTLTYPYLDADLTVNSQRKHIGIVNIHPQRMQRSPALLDFFRTGDFSTTQTTGDLDLDPFGAHPESRSNRHLDSTLVVDTIFDLAGNRIADDIRIQLRPADLQYIDLYVVFPCLFLQLFLDPVYLSTTFTDDETRLGSVDRYN